jgi:hypothetical protein
MTDSLDQCVTRKKIAGGDHWSPSLIGLYFCQFAKPSQDRKRSKELEQYGSDQDYGHIAYHPPRRMRCASGGYGGSLLAGQANVSSHFCCGILTGLILSTKDRIDTGRLHNASTHRLSRRPFAPMCGVKVNSSLSGSFDPATDNAAAGKQHRMFAARIDNRQFQIAVEWHGGYFVLPHKLSPTHRKVDHLIDQRFSPVLLFTAKNLIFA